MKKRTLFSIVALVGGAAYVYKKLNVNVKRVPNKVKRTRKVYEFEGDYTSITVTDRVEDILVIQSNDDILRIVCYENDDYYYDITETDQLIVTPIINADSFGNFKGTTTKDKHYLEVHVPKRLNINLIAKKKNAKLSVKDIQLKNLYSISANGPVIVSDANIRKSLMKNLNKL